MQIHNLQRAHPNRHRKIVGRGGKRGKTAGRGTKGQRARAGHRIRPEFRDLIKKLPKLRGYRFQSFERKPIPVNLDQLEVAFPAGATVSARSLLEKGIIKEAKGRTPIVKILGRGKLAKALKLSGLKVSAPVRQKIESVGGEVK